jgi:hypothetical protein
MPDSPTLLHALLLLVFTLVAHGLILFNDGLYWDGWMIDSWQRRKAWGTMKRFFAEVGMPNQHYLHKFIARFPNRSLVYRLLVVASTYASALAIYLTAPHFGLDHTQALVLALLYLAYTGYHMNVDCIIVLQYGLPVAMFYWGAYMAFAAVDHAGAAHWGLRLAALALFWGSFSANSILVYYFGFLGLLVGSAAGFTDAPWHNAVQGLLKYPDYAALPFVFWIVKERLAPRHGAYVSYNRFNLGPVMLARGFFNAIRSGVESAIIAPFRSALEANFLWVGLAALALACYSLPGAADVPGLVSPPLAVHLMTAGAVLCLLAAAPYILVGRDFSPGGWNTKHHLLFHLPVSMMVLGAGGTLLSARAFVPAMVLILAVNAVHLNLVYLYYVAVAAKDHSWLHKLDRIPGARAQSVFYLHDQHSIQGDHYFPQLSPAYSFYMFDRLWGERTHIGFHVRASHRGRLSDEEIRRRMSATTLEYDMDVDIHGSHAKLVISDGLTRTPLRLAAMYLIAKYLPGGDMNKILEDIADLGYVESDSEA